MPARLDTPVMPLPAPEPRDGHTPQTRLAEGALYAGDPSFYKAELQRYAAATPAGVQAAARRWINDGAYALTDAGRALCSRLTGHVERFESEHLNGISKQDIAAARRVLEHLYERLRPA